MKEIKMNELLNYVTMPYDIEQEVLTIAYGVMIAVVLLVVTFKSYKKHKKLAWLEKLLIGIAISLIAIVSLGGIPSVVEKYHWTYVFNQNEIYLYDLSEGDEYGESNLIQSFNFSELTPYFSYEKKVKGRQTRKRTVVIAEVILKAKDGSDFLKIKTPSLDKLINKYQAIHEKNPKLLDRMVILEGDYYFEKFVERLSE